MYKKSIIKPFRNIESKIDIISWILYIGEEVKEPIWIQISTIIFFKKMKSVRKQINIESDDDKKLEKFYKQISDKVNWHGFYQIRNKVSRLVENPIRNPIRVYIYDIIFHK